MGGFPGSTPFNKFVPVIRTLKCIKIRTKSTEAAEIQTAHPTFLIAIQWMRT